MNRKDFFKASLALALSGVTLSAVGSNYFGEGEAPRMYPEDARLTPEEVERIGKEMARQAQLHYAMDQDTCATSSSADEEYYVIRSKYIFKALECEADFMNRPL